VVVNRDFFKEKNRVPERDESYLSPSGLYRLDVSVYGTEKGYFDYSRGAVVRVADETTIAVVLRNYCVFWHTWCLHPNGNEYLLCGEDYQGQTVVNCTQGTMSSFVPKSAEGGDGFCWAHAIPSPDGSKLAVEGCYWACPYQVRVYDFSEPDRLPFKLLQFDVTSSLDSEIDFDSLEGWDGNDSLRLATSGEVLSVPLSALEVPSEEQRTDLELAGETIGETTRYLMVDFVEECWLLRGFKAGGMYIWLERYVSRGTTGSVDFNWEKAWDDPRLVGWRHTHPGVKFDTPSSVDDRTMRSWVKATGRPMICGITCGDSTRHFMYVRSEGSVYRFEMKVTGFGPFKLGHIAMRSVFCPVDTEHSESEGDL